MLIKKKSKSNEQDNMTNVYLNKMRTVTHFYLKKKKKNRKKEMKT